MKNFSLKVYMLSKTTTKYNGTSLGDRKIKKSVSGPLAGHSARVSNPNLNPKLAYV